MDNAPAMNDLHETAQALVAAGQGDPRRGREHRNDQEALRRDRRRVDRGEPPRLPRASLHDARRRGRTSAASSSSTRRSASTRPTARRSRSCSRRRGSSPGSRSTRVQSRSPSHRGRDDHRGTRRAPRALRGVPQPRRALRKVARDLLDRRRPAERGVRLGRTPMRSPVTRRLPRKAGLVPIVEPEVLMDGDAHDRGEREGDRTRARRRSTRSCTTSASTSAGTLLKPNMVLVGLRGGESRRRRRGGGANARVPLPARACGGARDRLPLRRPVRRGRDRASQRDERARPASMAALVLIRTRAPGGGTAGMARQA